MAVLEAFVYDPLINWRLMQTDVEVRRPEGELALLAKRHLLPKENIETTLNPVRVAELARVGHPQGPMRKLKADENDIFNGECWPN